VSSVVCRSLFDGEMIFCHPLSGNRIIFIFGAGRRVINGENIYTTSLSMWRRRRRPRGRVTTTGVFRERRRRRQSHWRRVVADDIRYDLVDAQLLVVFARSRQRKSIPRRFYTTDRPTDCRLQLSSYYSGKTLRGHVACQLDLLTPKVSRWRSQETPHVLLDLLLSFSPSPLTK